MQIYYPKSFVKLAAMALALVALPLVIALLTSALSVDRFASRSQDAVHAAVRATQASRRMSELVTSLERSARQYAILRDEAMLGAYVQQRGKLLALARDAGELMHEPGQRAAVEELLRREAEVYARLSKPEPEPAQIDDTVRDFVALNALAQSINLRSAVQIDSEVAAMGMDAERVRRVLGWQVLGLVPVVVFLVGGFAVLIARPIRQIDDAIRALGDGDFTRPVEVGGPQDLQHLGRRLDWMRCRIVELEQHKNRFLQQVSHELKTPLAVLREGTDLLCEGALGALTPDQLEIVRMLREKSLRLQRLIEELLTYGALQFQKAGLERSTVALRAVVDRVVADQEIAWRAKGLSVRVDAPELIVHADEEKLRVIVDNLVSNAVKFSPQGATILIEARAGTDGVELDVVDQGPGIAPHERDRVFEPFYSGDAVPGSTLKSSGLGLSIARELVLAHGGRIGIVDDPRAGAHVRITLPRVAPAQAPAATAGAAA
jgi:two-component system sensor histidine kinase GlrK